MPLAFQPAELAELALYLECSRAAQKRLRAKGLAQYLPAAHAEYADAMRQRIVERTLWTVRSDGAIAGFLNIDPRPSVWWPPDQVLALYLAGLVVVTEFGGRSLGSAMLDWCQQEARRRGLACLRLDCHAGNAWLRSYYESYGFQLRGFVPMHPGYDGCLYELPVEAASPCEWH